MRSVKLRVRWSDEAVVAASALQAATMPAVTPEPSDRMVLDARTIASMGPAERERWSEILGAEVLEAIAASRAA